MKRVEYIYIVMNFLLIDLRSHPMGLWDHIVDRLHV